MFLPILSDAADFAAFESAAIDAGHACVAEVMVLALEALDARLMAERPRSLKCHDVRRRVFATEVGDASFSLRRYRDAAGNDAYPLADALDLPWGARVPRMARERSMGAARRARRERKELVHLERRGLPVSKVVQSAGSGYLPPHQVDTGRIDAGKAYALHAGMAKLG